MQKIPGAFFVRNATYSSPLIISPAKSTITPASMTKQNRLVECELKALVSDPETRLMYSIEALTRARFVAAGLDATAHGLELPHHRCRIAL